MKLLSLEVEHFRCVRRARVTFGPGLNVLHGPNDLGKSSLAAAIRAALLLPVKSKEHEAFVPWQDGGVPRVELVFETEPQRIWRVRKTFGSAGQAYLDVSRDGQDFRVDKKAREVDGKLRRLLRWGLAAPGGRGGAKGMPSTFLTTALLADQEEVGTILARALEDDADESGRKFLIEALEAMAQDPKFRQVLEQTQRRVDEAFTATGRKKGGRTSIWTRITDEISRAQQYVDQCRERSGQTGVIEAEIRDLQDERLECLQGLEQAEGVMRQIREAFEQSTLRRQATAELEQRGQKLERIENELRQVAEASAEQTTLRESVETLRRNRETAKAALAKAAGAVTAAEGRLQRLRSKDHARERLLRKQTLREQIALVEKELNEQSTLARAAEAFHAAETALAAAGDGVEKLDEQQTATARTLTELEGEIDELRKLRDWLAVGEAEQALAGARAEQERIAGWRKEARSLRTRAKKLETALKAVRLPSPDEARALARLEEQRRLAAARLEVGLNVEIAPQAPFGLRVARDGKKSRARSLKNKPLQLDAERSLELSIEDVADIRITGGNEDDRAQLEALEQRWRDEARPVLAAAAVETAEALTQAITIAERQRDEAGRLRADADGLDERAGDGADLDARIERWTRQRDAARSALGDDDPKRLARLAGEQELETSEDVDRSREPLLARQEAARDAHQALAVQLAEARARRDSEKKRRDEARQVLDRVAGDAAGEPSKLLAGVATRREALAAELERLSAEVGAVESEEGQAVGDAEATLAEAREIVARKQAEDENLAEKLQATEKRLNEAEGELRVRQRHVAALDVDAARQSVDEAQRALDAIPEPLNEIDQAQLEKAEGMVTTARARLADVEGQIQAKRGALEHVGGDVSRDRTEVAEEALRLAVERAHETELDYDAWKLLRETLKEAEDAQGAHLGEALVDPVTERFKQLTGGRYGAPDLGPDLTTRGIHVDGRPRDVNALSVGTRDQLATILRLSLAEQLGSTLLLDDQLTQTDADRMDVLRDLIRHVAAGVQIVVLTCNPRDYLSGSDDAAVHVVDLSKAIERAGRATKPPRREAKAEGRPATHEGP